MWNLPTLEEEAIPLDEEPELPETPKSASLLKCLEIPEWPEPSKQIDAQPAESTEQTDTLSTSPLPSPEPQPGCHPSWKAKKPQREIGPDPNQADKWVHSYLQKERVPEWWREFISLLHSKDEHFSDAKVKGIACQQAVAFRCQLHSWKRTAGGPLYPVWVCWGKKTIFPLMSSRELEIIKWCGMKKEWHWPWPRGVCLSFWNAPRHALWSSTRALKMPHHPTW